MIYNIALFSKHGEGKCIGVYNYISQETDKAKILSDFINEYNEKWLVTLDDDNNRATAVRFNETAFVELVMKEETETINKEKDGE